ncbi:MAG: hypothetical protein ACR2HJ_02675 [Fimbriimonadales bacterium]
MRNLFCAVLAVAGSAALAQAPFTIVKPLDGAKVRETVPITLPKNSVPAGSFIGVTLDGKFLEATVPVPNAKNTYLIYWLNTKKHKIADGWHTVGVSLFANTGGRPQISDKSEIKVHVGNNAGIAIPANGSLIRYKFYPGMRSVYTVKIGEEVSTLTEAQNKLGGRAAQLPLGSESMRMLFAVDDVRGGYGLVRSQILPYKGKDYVVATVSGDEKPTVHKSDEFAPIYRILRTTGAELYGDIPNYWGFEGTGTDNVEMDLFAFIPLPILPTERLQVGDSWQASIAMGGGTIPEVRNTGKSIEKIPARGTFEAVEWERGEPCAKLRYELEFGQKDKDSKDLSLAGREFKQNDKLRFQQLAWISYRTGKLVRSDMIVEADTKVGQGDSGMGGGGGGNTGGPQPMDMGGRGGRGGRGGMSINYQIPMGKGGGQTAPGGKPGGGQQGGGGGTFVRMKFYLNMVLEK